MQRRQTKVKQRRLDIEEMDRRRKLSKLSRKDKRFSSPETDGHLREAMIRDMGSMEKPKQTIKVRGEYILVDGITNEESNESSSEK